MTDQNDERIAEPKYCKKCGRGIGFWSAPDESPCHCAADKAISEFKKNPLAFVSANTDAYLLEVVFHQDEEKAAIATLTYIQQLTARIAALEREIQTHREYHRVAIGERDQFLDDLNRLRARFTAPIVCICGSTKFKQTWISENARLTGEGNIVLAVGLWGHHERVYPDAETKLRLDETHKRKIDLCDWVWVIDVNGYIGDSTRSEIEYATRLGKPVRYLSQEFPDFVEKTDPLQAENAALRASLDAERANSARLERALGMALKGCRWDEIEAALATPPPVEGKSHGP